METALQGSLLDLADAPAPGPLGGTVRRRTLAHGAWADVRPGWMTGADVLFSRLRQVVPWREERRRMYERVVEVPRLLCFYAEGQPLPDPALAAARDALDAHYGPALGEPLVTAGLCLYRDGRDSVAWHGDRIGRGATEDTVVAILSLGAPRALLLRPRGGGPVLRHDLGHGDLLVMGGSCQRTWEHAVPKSARATGPRISVQFRPRGVRLPRGAGSGRAPARVPAGRRRAPPGRPGGKRWQTVAGSRREPWPGQSGIVAGSERETGLQLG